MVLKVEIVVLEEFQPPYLPQIYILLGKEVFQALVIGENGTV